MPELPEVETVRRILEPIVKSQKIVDITVVKKRIIHGDIDDFRRALMGETFLKISRIGKYLIFHLSHDKILISHLRMEGKYLELLPDMPLSPYARVIFLFEDGRRLVYDDSRQFGTMTLSDVSSYLFTDELAKLGPEPFVASYHDVYLKIRRSTRPIKSLLLDQTLVCGLGNIYVDEVLFASKIHPLTPGTMLKEQDVSLLLSHSMSILNQAIAAGGSTIRTYHPGNGISGDFQTAIVAYNQAGKPCVVCGHKMKKIMVGGRGTTYCPHCQMPKHRPTTVAITGPIASGKSVLTHIYEGLGYPILSSDAIVHQLYEDTALVLQLEKALGHKITHYRKLDKTRLRHLIIDQPKMKKALEAFMHPLVEQAIEDFITTAKTDMVFVEVPLLFQAHMESHFDYVIGIIAPIEKQQEFLQMRGQSIHHMGSLNTYEQFKKYTTKVDYLILNLGDYDALVEKAKEMLVQLKKIPN